MEFNVDDARRAQASPPLVQRLGQEAAAGFSARASRALEPAAARALDLQLQRPKGTTMIGTRASSSLPTKKLALVTASTKRALARGRLRRRRQQWVRDQSLPRLQLSMTSRTLTTMMRLPWIRPSVKSFRRTRKLSPATEVPRRSSCQQCLILTEPSHSFHFQMSWGTTVTRPDHRRPTDLLLQRRQNLILASGPQLSRSVSIHSERGTKQTNEKCVCSVSGSAGSREKSQGKSLSKSKKSIFALTAPNQRNRKQTTVITMIQTIEWA